MGLLLKFVVCVNVSGVVWRWFRLVWYVVVVGVGFCVFVSCWCLVCRLCVVLGVVWCFGSYWILLFYVVGCCGGCVGWGVNVFCLLCVRCGIWICCWIVVWEMFDFMVWCDVVGWLVVVWSVLVLVCCWYWVWFVVFFCLVIGGWWYWRLWWSDWS